MSTNNNAQLLLENYGNYDLFSKADSAQIADLTIEDATEAAQFIVTQDGTYKARTFKQVVPDTSFNIQAADLARDNSRLFAALQKAGFALGKAVLNRGRTTVTYQLFVGEKPMVQVGNGGGFSTISLKFNKQ